MHKVGVEAWCRAEAKALPKPSPDRIQRQNAARKWTMCYKGMNVEDECRGKKEGIANGNERV